VRLAQRNNEIISSIEAIGDIDAGQKAIVIKMSAIHQGRCRTCEELISGAGSRDITTSNELRRSANQFHVVRDEMCAGAKGGRFDKSTFDWSAVTLGTLCT
jgi:hypothetical protein